MRILPAQAADHADRPGSYQPTVRLSTAVIDPGDALVGELFISGYGAIDGGKLVFYPSAGIIDDTRSHFTSDLKKDEGGLLIWGGGTRRLDAEGVSISLNGGINPDGHWPKATMFFDMREKPDVPPQASPPQIATEVKLAGVAPISFFFQTRRRVRPGTYSLTFLLTYFNGTAWVSSQQTTQFTIRNILQRYDLPIAVVAAIAAGTEILELLIHIADHLRHVDHAVQMLGGG